jgi:putative phosphoribosyl transferase
MVMVPFKNRTEAGRLLASKLQAYADRPLTLVLGIPRGGVLVAFEVAQALHLPLDIFVVRKLGVPSQPELAMGALDGGGFYLLNQEVIDAAGISKSEIQEVLRRERKELERRERLYRDGRKAFPVVGQTVILVDDGLATGASVRVAIRILKSQHPERLILAVPVAPPDTCEALKSEVDEVICLATPEPFRAIGCWYQDFTPTTDEDVRRLLSQPSLARGL